MKNLKRHLCLALCLWTLSPLFAGAFAGAQDQAHSLDRELEQCLEADGSTAGMKACTYSFLPKWDAVLNKYYALLGGDRNPELRRAQVAWIAFSAAESAWIAAKYDQVYVNSGGGTMWGLNAISEQLNLRRRRALELIAAYELLSGEVQ